MLRIILLLIGVALSIFQSYNAILSVETQFLTFLFGILILGIPHGAADLLVANENETAQKQRRAHASKQKSARESALKTNAIINLNTLVNLVQFVHNFCLSHNH